MNYISIQIIKTIDELLSYQKMVELYTRRKTMPNIKITAEVDGKQVPLETVSTETFEAIKALEKPKEIPVARWATNKSGRPRLLFKPVNNIRFDAGYLYALDLERGVCSNQWTPIADGLEISTYYENVKPL